MTARLVALFCVTITANAAAQVTMTAKTFGSGVAIDGVPVVAAGIDVLPGFQHVGSNSTGFVSVSTLTVASSEQSIGATLSGSAKSPHWVRTGAVHAEVEFVITSPVPMLVDVSLQIISEGSTRCGGVEMGRYFGSSQLLGFGPLTNRLCNASPFAPPCRFTFEPMLVDARGLTIQLVVDASVGSSGMCPLQSSGTAVAFDVVPSECGQEYGTACGTNLSAVTGFSMPGQYNITVSDPGAQLGALLIGTDQIAMPLLGCTLLTTPLVSLPLPLDPTGKITFQSGLPVLPFSLQAVTAENLVIHMSQGLLACK